MTLLKLLLKLLMSSSSTNTLSQNTGIDQKLIMKLLPLAIPILLKAMTNNSSSGEGALSLLNALGQHTSSRSMPDQLKEADAEDGSKIIGHILGGNREKEIEGLAKQTGLTNDQVGKVLNNIAPSLLSGMSGVLANGLPEENKGFFAKLFGKREKTDVSLDGTDLLKALKAVKK